MTQLMSRFGGLHFSYTLTIYLLFPQLGDGLFEGKDSLWYDFNLYSTLEVIDLLEKKIIKHLEGRAVAV